MTGSGRTGRKATHRQQAVYTGAQRATAPLRPEPLSTQGQPPHMARWAGAKPRWVVEGVCLAEPVPEVAEQRQGLLLAGRGGRVVRGLFLGDAQGVEGVGLAVQVAEVAEQRQGLLLAGGSGRVVPGQLLHQAQVAKGVGLSVTVTSATGQYPGLLVAGGGGRVVPR